MTQKMLADLEQQKFYGTLELKFEAGKVVLIRKTESFKPLDPTYRNNGSPSNDRKS